MYNCAYLCRIPDNFVQTFQDIRYPLSVCLLVIASVSPRVYTTNGPFDNQLGLLFFKKISDKHHIVLMISKK